MLNELRRLKLSSDCFRPVSSLRISLRRQSLRLSQQAARCQCGHFSTRSPPTHCWPTPCYRPTDAGKCLADGLPHDSCSQRLRAYTNALAASLLRSCTTRSAIVAAHDIGLAPETDRLPVPRSLRCWSNHGTCCPPLQPGVVTWRALSSPCCVASADHTMTVRLVAQTELQTLSSAITKSCMHTQKDRKY